MGIFQKKKMPEMQFRTRSEAFNAMLAYLVEEKGVEPLDAARQANEFAEIFATNMGIPVNIEPEKKGVDKYISIAEKIGNYAESHPKAIEALLGIGTFFAGVFTGKKVESADNDRQHRASEAPKEPIDFDNIQ